ncbi:hypothetical protein [Salmonella phage SS9]|nr:acyl carrier protein [Salmonella phage 38]YP_009879532.1 acyl carrier protein [Escherichia phage FEC14]YP_009883239.1 acyl carrier protein [Salmonella phage SS9]QEI24061.1 hypothetical protein [Salmonella phage SS3]UGL60289.1 hypothetical protein [Salmonella phage vB_SenAc-pSC20]AKJ73730.1 hypothetical protein SP38_128 [Salmonella phage 38]ATW66814.1 hypothetical protein [Escherichia phage FEC14]QEI24315.1 hypothetical protein [Salmonella phage SS9]
MSNKPTYVEVMRHLAQYATDNLNLEVSDEDKSSIKGIVDAEVIMNDALDKLAGLRTKKDLGGDDLDAIEIVMELEEEFNVEISDGWLGGKGDDPTMGELAEYVVALRK